MGYGETKIVKVIFPSDKKYWAKVKTSLPYGELKKYFEYGGTDGPLSTPEKLKLSITEWNIDGDDGSVLPITVENIDLLQEIDILAIADVATPRQSEESKKK